MDRHDAGPVRGCSVPSHDDGDSSRRHDGLQARSAHRDRSDLSDRVAKNIEQKEQQPQQEQDEHRPPAARAAGLAGLWAEGRPLFTWNRELI